MAAPKFPKVLYVRQEYDGDDTYFYAYATLDEAVEDGGSTRVATYALQGERTYAKVVSEVS